jgi:hypothetical protein
MLGKVVKIPNSLLAHLPKYTIKTWNIHPSEKDEQENSILEKNTIVQKV